MIKFRHIGNFEKTEKFLRNNSNRNLNHILKKYAEEGVQALKASTPKDTGKTSESWGYEIITNSSGVTISWKNSNYVKGVSIALILQYGHATRNGGYVQGVDYINPALKPVFEKILKEVWGEVTKN